MSDSWFDDHVSPLLDELTTLKELDRNAKTARGETKARIAKIKSETRLKDRHRWLASWANGDLSVCKEYQSLRHTAKHLEQRIADLPHTCQAVLGELDQVIADNFEQNNPAYRGIVIEQRELRRKRDVCRDALTLVRNTRENITRVSASLHVEPQGRAAVATAKKKPGEISDQLKVVRKKVAEVNRIVGSHVRLANLDVTFLGTEFGPDQRKKQLDGAVKTLYEVARKVEAGRDKFEKRLRELEKDRARMVKAKRDHLVLDARADVM